MVLAEGCAWEENFCAAFATTVSEQTCDSISEDIVASVDSSRLTAEDVVTIVILCRAAKGVMLRKAHREAETPPEKSLPFSRGSPLCRELRGRACEPGLRVLPLRVVASQGSRESLGVFLVN